MSIALTAADSAVWVAAITGVCTLFGVIVNAVYNSKAKKPIQGTYKAVNDGRMERIEGAVFGIQESQARLEGAIDARLTALEDRL